MRVLAIVHHSDAGLGVFLDVIDEMDLDLDTWMPSEQPAPPADLDAYGAVISLGGVAHPTQVKDHPWIPAEIAVIRQALQSGTALLGVCLGSQLLAEAAGTRTRAAAVPEIGWYDVRLTRAAEGDPLFGSLPDELVTAVRADSAATVRSFQALEWHSYEVPLPPSATALAQSDTCLQAYRLGASAWGVQSHPEVTREDYLSWVSEGQDDPSWKLLRMDADDLQTETDEKIERWNDFGRALARRFLAFAAQHSASRN